MRLLIASAAELRRAKVLQTVLVGILFVAWALSSYGATWDGTWLGLLSVFLAVIAIDVTTDSLLEKVKAV